MSLQTLVFCADEKVARVLRRVLGELEIAVEQCTDADSAIQKLTRKRYEAVIVDCADPTISSRVLRSARTAPCNKRAVAVAIVSGTSAQGGGFDLGAHFVLYQPLSPERAKTSFRAVRALMKRERRRNARIAIETPVTLRVNDGSGYLRAVTTDLGEGGMAIQAALRPKNLGPVHVQLTLPGTEHVIECTAEVAWENASRQLGLRFQNLPSEMRDRLQAWLQSRSPEFEQDDPPSPCKLTDLSLGACYLETGSPFPARTRIILSLKSGAELLRADGVVMVMHAEVGMGVEFTQTTAQQREQLDKLIHALSNGNGTLPELLVEPEGLENSEPVSTPKSRATGEDPLLDLFRRSAELTPKAFHSELRKQRSHDPKAAAHKASV
ncbi:MAG TPA: PilZ domain-containing protein [Terriglobales bacterium]|jgi:DNA-binding response OmpR family regulator|nr:PilZ domain-containing protein [Terriglobales bacterium]